MKKYYSMQTVVKKTGLTKDALRYYEKIGVIQPIKRDQNNYRQFTEDDVEWLKLVKLLREMGFSANALINAQQASYAKRQQAMQDYRQEIQAQIASLQRLDDLLAVKIDYLSLIDQPDQPS